MDWKEKYPQWVTKNGGIKPQAPLEVRQEVFIERSKELHSNKYDYSQVVYLNNATKVIIVCPTHGPWESVPNNHLTLGNGCKKCSIEGQTKTSENFILEAKKVHGNLYDYSLAKYTGAHRKLVILCKNHGEFSQAPHEHLKGQGCPTCARNQIKTTDLFIKQATEVHCGKYLYNNTAYYRDYAKVIVTCREHGDFSQEASAHLQGQGCPTCGGTARKTTKQFIEGATEVHKSRYSYEVVDYKNSKTKVTITCKDHGNFEQAPSDHLQGKGCPLCTDKSESKIVYILTDGTNNYKIGIAHDIEKRRKQLEKSCSFELKLIAYKELSSEKEARSLESNIHALDYDNPYDGAEFDGYTEWRTINQHDLEVLIAINGFTVAP